jgi:hypothetical protein
MASRTDPIVGEAWTVLWPWLALFCDSQRNTPVALRITSLSSALVVCGAVASRLTVYFPIRQSMASTAGFALSLVECVVAAGERLTGRESLMAYVVAHTVAPFVTVTPGTDSTLDLDTGDGATLLVQFTASAVALVNAAKANNDLRMEDRALHTSFVVLLRTLLHRIDHCRQSIASGLLRQGLVDFLVTCLRSALAAGDDMEHDLVLFALHKPRTCAAEAKTRALMEKHDRQTYVPLLGGLYITAVRKSRIGGASPSWGTA